MSQAARPTMGILVSGGPAPGINGVIAAATIEAVKRGWRVIGVLEGYRHLVDGRLDAVRELDVDAVSRIHLTGGSILGTSRVSPAVDPATRARATRALVGIGIDRLVSIGGDGSAYSAHAIHREAAGKVRVVHVPKTIDNDIPLPGGQPTFGFDTARHEGARALRRLATDAKTSRRWYLATAMGRSTGHLALGIAKAAGSTLAVLPEELTAGVPFAFVRDLVLGAMLARLASGRPHGTIVLAEGVALKLEDAVALPGAARPSRIPLGRRLEESIAVELAALGVDLSLVAVDVGYELRCAEPVSTDLVAIRDLGFGAVAYLAGGGSGAVLAHGDGRLTPVELDSMIDPGTRRVRTRAVDLASASYRVAREFMIRLGPADLEDPARLAALATAARMEPAACAKRFAPIVDPASPHLVPLPPASWPFAD